MSPILTSIFTHNPTILFAKLAFNFTCKRCHPFDVHRFLNTCTNSNVYRKLVVLSESTTRNRAARDPTSVDTISSRALVTGARHPARTFSAPAQNSRHRLRNVREKTLETSGAGNLNIPRCTSVRPIRRRFSFGKGRRDGAVREEGGRRRAPKPRETKDAERDETTSTPRPGVSV